MAHNLSTHTDADGIARSSFYSHRIAGWHGLGQVVDKPLADPDVIKAAGLDWTANEVGLYRADMVPVEDHKAIVRSDTGKSLGIVGTDYRPLQNSALLAYFRDVAGTSDMVVETAGALGNGEVVWALAKIPGLRLAKGDDVSNAYLMIRNNHDGNGCVSVNPTTIRVVCENTLRMANAQAYGAKRTHGRNTLRGGFKIRHTSGLESALADVASAYAQTREDWQATQAAFSALTGKPLTSPAFEAMMRAAFDLPADMAKESDRVRAMVKARAEKVAAILASPTCQVAGTAGTLWAGLNAITEYIDHEARTRGDASQSDAAQRFASSCFGGTGDKAKASAFDAALALV